MKFVLLALAFSFSISANAMNPKETTTSCPYKSAVGLHAQTQVAKGQVKASPRGQVDQGRR